MKIVLSILVLAISPFTLACEEIYGKYKSVSETHWNFELEISNENVVLVYTDYFYGERDMRTDQKIVSQGHCEKTAEGYKLSFAQMSIPIEFHKALSRESFGGSGVSPGVTGEFIEGQQVELWQNM